MNRSLTLMLTFALLLSACGTTSAPPATTAAGSNSAGTNPTSAPANSGDANQTGRTATFTEITGQVEARAAQTGEFAPASDGLTLTAGGETRTGEDGKARLDLVPDGTIIRVVPNTSFTLTDLSGGETDPSSKIELFFGQVFILLKGGSLDVETPSGVASVRGSLLGVSFDAQTKKLTATCREGHCSLSDEDESIELTAGEAVDSFDGDIADEPRPLTEEEIQEWQEEVPEADEFLEENPEATEAPTEVATEAPTDVPTDAPTDAPVPTDAPTEPPADGSANTPIESGGGR